MFNSYVIFDLEIGYSDLVDDKDYATTYTVPFFPSLFYWVLILRCSEEGMGVLSVVVASAYYVIVWFDLIWHIVHE